jgi:phosphoglycerate dehydrogenase-like enzyme
MSARPMKVLVPAGFARGGLPEDVELTGWDAPGEGVEIVVPASRDAAERLGGLPDLQIVQVLSAGVDWVEAHVPEGVTLCNAGDTRSPAVAQWVAGAILADAIGFRRAEDARRAQRWEHWQPAEVAGRRAVIVGHGSIGRAVERRLAPFGVRIVRVARRRRPGVEPVERLPELVEDADVVVVLAPLTEATRGLVGERVIGSMRDGALLVNAGRGPVIDTDALVAALEQRRIRAALDVTDPEPLPEGHPLWRLPGVLITPHNAGDTPEAEVAAQALARAQILRHRAGLPLRHVVSGPARPGR